ncbi:uncharacterized protein [Spinacia oleracea]|uniref:Trypsin inhibitor domain-containing protein n=1 Tax=Spinacia oleracea TaxID=3562 RepID=A0A9R0JS07_SPIOL|nr:uncharacterized protein LOC110784333 [Spinacia oleracea]
MFNYFKLVLLLVSVLAYSGPTNAKMIQLGGSSSTEKEAATLTQELIEAQLKSVGASYEKAKMAEFEFLQKLVELRQPRMTSNEEGVRGGALKCDPSGASCSPAFQAKNVCCSGLCVPVVLSFYGICA